MRNNASRLRATRGLIPVALLGMGVALAPALASDWPELRGDATRRGVSSEKVVPPLSLLWRYSAGSQSQNSCAPTIVGDTVYYATRANGDATSGGVVFALDVKTGAKKWQYPKEVDGNGLRDKHLFLTAPLVYKDRVYIGASDGNMYVLDAKTGQYLMQFRTSRAINSSPTVVGGVLYFGSNDGKFYALNPETGEQAWRQQYEPRDSVNSAPIIAAGYIFFTTNDNTVHAVTERSGIFRWKQRLPYRILPNAAIFSDATLYVPSGPRLTAIQPPSGLIRWQRQLPSDILTAPVADNGIVYVACREDRGTGAVLYAFRANNGKLEWEAPAKLPLVPAAAPTISGDVIYIPTNRNMLLAVSRIDGKVLWEYYVEPSANRPINTSAGGFTSTSLTAPVSISEGTVYALSDDGALSAFRADAPDSSGPTFSNHYPPLGRAVSGQPPVTLAAYVMDTGSGLNPESIEVRLDNQKVDAIYDPTRNIVVYQTQAKGKVTDQPLQDGRHSVTITAADWRGNKSSETWSFRVNNALPPASSRETPAPARPRPGINAPGGNRPVGNRPGGGTRPNPGRGGNRGNTGGNTGGCTTPPPPPSNP